MLSLSWCDKRLVAFTVNIDGFPFLRLWPMPYGDDIRHYMRTHVFGDFDPEAFGSEIVTDSNTISWGPSMDPDNWCIHQAVEGELQLSLLSSQIASYQKTVTIDDETFTEFHFDNGNTAYTSNAVIRQTWWATLHIDDGSKDDNIHIMLNNGGYISNYYVTLTYHEGYYHRHIERYYASGYYTTEDVDISYLDDTSRLQDLILQRPYTAYFKSQYQAMCRYAHKRMEDTVFPDSDSAADWFASLDAADGFHPYDINMVENLFGFGIDDLFPKKTSAKALNIITEAVNSQGGLLSPRGLVACAQIAANMYLHNKYVVMPNASDLSDILVGDDNPFYGDIVRQIFANGNTEPTPFVNRKLKRLAEIIVYRGERSVTTYGNHKQSVLTDIGRIYNTVNARLKAYPQYYEDMSTAAIICDEIGLTLTPKRLTEVIPFEFIAQWFLPIEQNVHSIEQNSAVLNMMYKVENLSLSHKRTCTLDTSYLCAMFGLSGATGELSIKTYSRGNSKEFPPTALTLSLHPELNVSRILQGSSMLITNL